MNTHLKVLILLAVVATPTVGGGAAQEKPAQDLCVADQSTGFVYQEGEWRSVVFNASGGRWLVHQGADPGGIKRAQFGVKDMGTDNDRFLCERGFNTDGDLECRSVVSEVTGSSEGTFQMNRETNRFITTATFGYWRMRNREADAKSDNPYISIGKCSAF